MKTMKTNVKHMTTTALMAAVICVLGPLTIPVGPVPVSLANFAVFLMMYLLDLKHCLIAYLLYLLIGLAGLPVFSGFSGGPAKLFGPTGGYLVGYIPMIALMGLLMKNNKKKRLICIAAMILGSLVLYLFGTSWLAFSANMSFAAALAAGVLPFILIDLAKILLASFLGPLISERISR